MRGERDVREAIWICHLGSATLDSPLGIRHSGSSTRDLPLGICHLGSAARHLPQLTDPKLSQVFHSEGKWGMAGREETSSAVKEVLIRRARPMYFNPYARSLFRKLRSVRTLLN